jgi:PEP-CTERM/exosortase A-associated glycosyltransferase
MHRALYDGRPLRVLHVLDHSLPRLDGYAIRSGAILRFQAAAGIEPIAVTSPHHPGPAGLEVEEIDGVRYERMPGRRGRLPWLREGGALRRCARGISQRLGRHRPVLVHAHSPSLWGLAALRAAQRSRLPVVYEVRGAWEEAAVERGRTRRGSWRYRLARGLESYVCSRADLVVPLSRGLRDDLVGRGVPPERVIQVANGVDTVRFAPRDPDAEIAVRWAPDGGPLIGYFGSLLAREGVDDLLDALPCITGASGVAPTLLIGGSGELAPDLEERAAAAGHAGLRVAWLGGIPHAEMERYYSVCDLVVYPRRSTRATERVTPLKPLEAMAMGRAVVASDVGGLRELLPPGTAVLVPPGDPAALARACRDLLANAERRAELGRRARLHAAERHDWRRLAERYRELYLDVLARRGAMSGSGRGPGSGA